ncbi:MAG: hypothetical protein IKE64_01385 [Thermoguttaceae bacterium]|nr:hypothetical protein [Thermoguttaceae bacterium]
MKSTSTSPKHSSEDGGLEELVNDKAGADGNDADAIKVTVPGGRPENKQESPPLKNRRAPPGPRWVN